MFPGSPLPPYIHAIKLLGSRLIRILGIELEHELVQGQNACALILTCVFAAMAHVGWGWSTFCVPWCNTSDSSFALLTSLMHTTFLSKILAYLVGYLLIKCIGKN